MKNKIIGIFVCTLLITTIVLPVCGAVSESNVKKSLESPGDYLRFMVFDKCLRSYRIHVPPNYDGSNPLPLVVVFHGMTGRATHMMIDVGWNAKADEEGFIAVYPNGHTAWKSFYELRAALYYLITSGGWGFWWNPWSFKSIDDIGFIQTLIEKLQTTLKINSSRIYITGFSQGAIMTYRLGAELSDTVAAIAPVAGSIGGYWTDNSPFYIIPEPEHPLSVIIFHGMNDSWVPYNGRWDFLSVNDSVSFWVEHDQCDPIPQINISESGNIIKKTYVNGSQGTEVVLYTIVDGHHGWFGAPGGPVGWYEYPCEISATDLMWEFFEAHPKQ